MCESTRDTVYRPATAVCYVDSIVMSRCVAWYRDGVRGVARAAPNVGGAPAAGAPGSVACILEDDSPSTGGIVGAEGRLHDANESLTRALSPES